jgi:hypothetical protein
MFFECSVILKYLVSLLSYIYFVLYYFTISKYVSYWTPFTHWSMQPHLKSEFCFLLAFHLVKYSDCMYHNHSSFPCCVCVSCMCSIHIFAVYCLLVWVVVIVFCTIVLSCWFSCFFKFYLCLDVHDGSMCSV